MKRKRDEEGVSSVDVGRMRYQAKDYEGALEAFIEAVKGSTGHFLLEALDRQAAAYEKLNALQAALRVSKEMIDIAPRTAKGYLRCGKVLQMKGEMELALKIYAVGVGKVKFNADRDQPTLENYYNRLRQKLAPVADFNPLAMLPIELAEMVCSYLSTCDLVTCLRVSPAWKRFLERRPQLWARFEATIGVRKEVTMTQLKCHLKRANFGLTHAFICWRRTNFDEKKFYYLMNNSPKLTHLEILNGNLGVSLLGIGSTSLSIPSPHLRVVKIQNLSLRQCAQVMASLSTCLEDAVFVQVKPTPRDEPTEFPRMRRLKNLILQAAASSRGPSHLSLGFLHRSTPTLETLGISGWLNKTSTDLDVTPLANLKSLIVSRTHIRRIQGVSKNLETLELSNMTFYPELSCATHSCDDGTKPPPVFPKLVSFVGDCKLEKVDDLWFRAGAENGTLKILRPSQAVAPRVDLPPCVSLEDLSLQGWYDLSEDQLSAIVKGYPNLRHLNLQSTRTTGVLVKEVVLRPDGKLETLDLAHCTHVSSDAIEWARAQGIMVNTSTGVKNRGRPRFSEAPFAYAV